MNTEHSYHSLEAAVQATFGSSAVILRRERVHGGDINDSYRLCLSTGEQVFVKCNTVQNAGGFRAEALGLWALRRAGSIRTPETLGLGIDEEGGFSFLLLEYIESAPRIKNYWEIFGHELAGMHLADSRAFVQCPDGGAGYGFLEDNLSMLRPELNLDGSDRKRNFPKGKWADFYRERKLLPPIRLAEHYFDPGTRKQLSRLLDKLDTYLREPEAPSLLHGDLWHGNMLCGSDGKAWILDPVAYIGDFETDIAITQLFGGFPPAFYAAYHEVNPIDRGYEERRDLYHLYHLLNHLNQFGRTYLGSVVSIIRRYA